MDKRSIRQSSIGLLAGAFSSILLLNTLNTALTGVILGIVIGCIYAVAFRSTSQTAIMSMMTAAAMGIVLWGSLSIIFLPLLAGQAPQWSPEGMRRLFPALVGWVLYGASLGLFTRALSAGANHLLGPLRQPPPPERVIKTRIVIVGGGFAGMTTAAHLEQLFGAELSVELILISETNSLLFTPMLAEVAGGSLEPTHISPPLRTSLRRTRVIYGRVEEIDVEQQLVRLPAHAQIVRQQEIPFDHLVLAVGSVSHFSGPPGIETTALSFKSLEDAIRIRERVIRLLEYADQEPDPKERRALLTFVIAGGGFAGAELAGALNDFVRGALPAYPGILSDEVHIIVVHSRDAILPELSPTLAQYAMERMQARGVTFRLNTRLIDAREGVVVLSSGEDLRSHLLIWTAGVKPHPLVQKLPAGHDQRGAILVDVHLAVPELPGIWALGDCAQVKDARTDTICPPTAQFALREASILARNIHAQVRHAPLTPFHFTASGLLCVVGYHTACAEIKGLRFSGFFAWLLWRGIYLAKLPSFERRLHVLSDWVIELFFPPDIVQTIELDAPLQSPEHARNQAPDAFVPNREER